MTPGRHNRARSIKAVLCLLAVLFLYTPLGTAAWSSYRASCCASGMCSIQEHHHHQAPAAPEDHMNCGHHAAGMMACSMSCCRNTEAAAVASAIFVLPLPVELSAPAALKSTIDFLQVSDSPRLLEPLSPPPRSVHAVA
jgi:hypothetical protein